MLGLIVVEYRTILSKASDIQIEDNRTLALHAVCSLACQNMVLYGGSPIHQPPVYLCIRAAVDKVPYKTAMRPMGWLLRRSLKYFA